MLYEGPQRVTTQNVSDHVRELHVSVSIVSLSVCLAINCNLLYVYLSVI